MYAHQAEQQDLNYHQICRYQLKCSIEIGPVTLQDLKLSDTFPDMHLPQLLVILEYLVVISNALLIRRRPETLIYHNDQGIDYLTDVFTRDPLFSKETCPNASDYDFMNIGHADAPLKAIIVCNIHAREILASELCLAWMDQLRAQQDILNHMNFRVFYRANSMRDKTMTVGNECIRKNKNGVDMNRNFPTEFNFYNESSTSQIYSGPHPMSQPFTQCLSSEIENEKPDFFLDIHTGEVAFYYQQGYNNKNELRILEDIGSLYVKDLQKITTLQKDGESINGHLFADLKVRKQIKYSILIETFAGMKGPRNKCYAYFNPVTKKEIQHQKKKWTTVINELARDIIRTELQKQQLTT